MQRAIKLLKEQYSLSKIKHSRACIPGPIRCALHNIRYLRAKAIVVLYDGQCEAASRR